MGYLLSRGRFLLLVFIIEMGAAVFVVSARSLGRGGAIFIEVVALLVVSALCALRLRDLGRSEVWAILVVLPTLLYYTGGRFRLVLLGISSVVAGVLVVFCSLWPGRSRGR